MMRSIRPVAVYWRSPPAAPAAAPSQLEVILRSAKIVVEPGRSDDTISAYRAYTDDFALRQPGILAVRLLRSLTMPNKFFLHSWWDSVASMQAAVDSPDYERVLSEAQRDFLERMSIYALDVLDADPRPPLPADPSLVVSRLVKVTLKPYVQHDIEGLYHRVTADFTRRQPGCLRVQLFRDRRVRDVYFVQSYWTDAEKMMAAIESDDLHAIREEALQYLEERMGVWELEIVADSERLSVFRP